MTVCCCPHRGCGAPCAEAAVDLLILELLALGLLTALNGAFALALPVWVWLGTATLYPVWLALHRAPLPNAARRGVTLALAVGYLVLLFVLQRTFLAGAQRVRGCRKTVPEYDSRANFAVVTSPIRRRGLFVLLAAIPVTAFLAAVTALARRCTAAGAGAAAGHGIYTAGRDRQRRLGWLLLCRLAGDLRRRGRCSESGCGVARDSAAYVVACRPTAQTKNWPLPVWQWPAPYCFCLHWRCARCLRCR